MAIEFKLQNINKIAKITRTQVSKSSKAAPEGSKKTKVPRPFIPTDRSIKSHISIRNFDDEIQP